MVVLEYICQIWIDTTKLSKDRVRNEESNPFTTQFGLNRIFDQSIVIRELLHSNLNSKNGLNGIGIGEN
jgi:hypothetical protein